MQRSADDGVSGSAHNADTGTGAAALTRSSPPASPDTHRAEESKPPYGVTQEQLDALSAMAYLVGSPLQRQQPCDGEATHPALLVAAKLLQQGVDPERVIQLVECRYNAVRNN